MMRTAGPLYCEVCGTRLGPGDLFCGQCGQRIGSAPPRSPVDYETVQPSLWHDIVAAWKGVFKKRLPIQRPTSAVYAWREPFTSPIGIIAIATVASIILAFAINTYVQCASVIGPSYCSGFSVNPGLIIIVAIVPAAYFIWLWQQARLKPEPWTIILLLFGLGAASTIPALVINSLLGIAAAPFLAGLVEEPCKIIGVFYLARHRRYGKEFDGPMDGLVWGATAAAGFAIVESTGYLVLPIIASQLNIDVGLNVASALLVRNLVGPGHMIWTGITAWWLGIVKATRGQITKRDIIPGISIAIVLHGLWNGLGLISFFILLPAYAYIFHKLATEAHREEIVWGYAAMRSKG